MEPLLTTVAASTLSQGVAFLYEQASEVLKAWRACRRGATQAPVTLTSPDAVSLGDCNPLLAPRDAAMEDTLSELRDLAEGLTSGAIDPNSDDARRIAADLRDYLEMVLQAPITFAGESPRSFEAGRVNLVTARVEGDVAGVRAPGHAHGRVGDVSVRSGDVGETGRVTGVELS
jgi:hypothetical protein